MKPDSVGVRASDAAKNLSTANLAFLPPANIAGPASAPFATSGATQNLTAMNITASTPHVSNGPRDPAANPTSVTFTANVVAASPTSNTPFSQVCFYLVTPSGAENGAGNAVTGFATGELSLLGCSSTVNTVDTGSRRRRSHLQVHVGSV